MSDAILKVLMVRRADNAVGADGLSVHLEETATALRALGVDVTITGDPETDPTPYDVVHLFCLPDSATALRALMRAQTAHKPVVVTPIYWNLQRLETEGHALIREWAPELVEEAAPDENVELVHEVERLTLAVVYGAATLLLPQSEREAAQIQADFGVGREAQRVVYNAVAPAFANGSAQRFSAKYRVRDFVLSVGRIDPRKNQYMLLRALEHDTLPIVLIGGSTAPEYVAACRQLGGTRTLILSNLNASEIADAGAAAHVHVLLTWGETAGLAALEAAAAGSNIVMTTESSGREYFGETAWHVEPGNAVEIRHAVLEAYIAPRGRSKERVLQNYTWERAAATTLAAYHDARAQPAPAFDFARALGPLAAAQANLVARQGREIENLWRAKSSAEAALTAYRNGRVVRALTKLPRF